MNALYLEIVDDVKNKIGNENYQKGDKLPSERELACYYKVSRIVVREAISVLRNEGLVVVYPGKGAYVTKPDPIIVSKSIKRVMENYSTTLEDVLEIRKELEVSIIKNVIYRANSKDIQKLYDIYSNMEKYKENVEQFVKLDEQFHLHLAKYTKNPLYEMLLNSFIEMTQHILFEFTRIIPESVVQAQKHHLNLIRCIEKGDKDAALDLIKSHMQILRDEIEILKERRII